MYVITANEIRKIVVSESGYVMLQQDILEYLLVVVKYVGEPQAFKCYELPIKLDCSV